MIEPCHPYPRLPVANSTATALRAEAARADGAPSHPGHHGGVPLPEASNPVLCDHCGRTASNGISCQGMCVADSGY
jgi:hypothetical protein